jgi:hypothetical protein
VRLQPRCCSTAAIDGLGIGDVLVVAEWDRATRSMMDGVHIIERINRRGLLIEVLDTWIRRPPLRVARGNAAM